jgi:hypothetical protein
VDSDAATQETPNPPPDDPGARWPRIADYWPDTAAESAPPWIPRPPKSGPAWFRPVGGLLLAVLLLAGTAFTVHRLAARPTSADSVAAGRTAPEIVPTTNPAAGPATLLPSPSPSPSASPSPSPSASSTSKKATAGPGAALPATGSFEFSGHLTQISVGTARLRDGLARVGTPDGAGVTPKLTVDGAAVRLTVSKNGRKGAARVAVVLDERVAWTIRLDGGVRRAGLDLSGGRVRAVDLAAGANRIDLALPRLGGTLPIRMSGGVHTWRIVTDGRVTARLLARDGAADVVFYGRDRGGIERGRTVTTTAGGPGGIEVDAAGGIGTLTVSAG